MPTLLFRSPSDSAARWHQALATAMPELEVRIWPDIGEPADIDYALIWAAPDRMLHDLPNLRLVFSVGAGVDHLLGDAVPAGIPVVRMIDPALTEGMVEYVLYHVLRHHRRMPLYEARQRRREWVTHDQVRPGERQVGMLGLGELGGECARALAALGFDVAGFSRRRRALEGVTCFAGDDEFAAFLRRSTILVCLLPLTGATRGLLDAGLFRRLPEGTVLIHAGRGPQLVEADLLAGLDEGRPGHAVLDVFNDEPLPADHPFWGHPQITVTPHIASLTHPETGAMRVAEGIARDRAGQLPEGAVDPARGY